MNVAMAIVLLILFIIIERGESEGGDAQIGPGRTLADLFVRSKSMALTCEDLLSPVPCYDLLRTPGTSFGGS